jgi:cytochrome c5
MPGNGLLITLALFTCATILRADETAGSEGKRLYEAACVQCHGLGPIEVTRDGRPGWEDTVQKMVVIGAQLNAAEMDIVVDYLTRHYGPATGDPMRTGVLPADSPLQTDGSIASDAVVLPDGAGRQLVQAHCTLCHDVGYIVATRRSAEDWRRYTINMLAQGGMSVTPDNLELMVAYLNHHFGNRDSGRQ